MCTFITLIAVTDDLDRVNAILSTLDRRGYSRRAARVDSPAVRRVLAAEEREYVLSRPPCDCGTFLGHASQGSATTATAPAAQIARYRRKGWSAVRIARAMAARDHADARPSRAQTNEDAAYWIGLMTALSEGLGLQRLGLMHISTGPLQEASRRRQPGGTRAQRTRRPTCWPSCRMR